MKRNALTVAAVAAGTMAIALAGLWPSGVVGKSITQNGLPAQIKTPWLKVSGCELSLRPTQKTYKPGAIPEVELTVVNMTDNYVSLTPTLRMTSLAGAGMMRSRSLPIPTETWMDCPLLTLEPGQTRVFRFLTYTKAAAGQTLGFTLSVGKKVIRMASATVPAAAVKQTTALKQVVRLAR